MNSLNGKIALITGAKGTLGAVVTEAFLSAEATVAGVSRAIAAADFPNAKFTAIPADLATAGAAAEVTAKVIERFGRIDILVHVMGGFEGGQSVADTSDATIDYMLDLNYRAAFRVARAVIPEMRRQAGGRILMVASRQGVEPAAMVGAYSASKAALVSLVKTIALENKDVGITANSVLPGAMGPKLVQPAQVAALLVHLAGDDAAQITGAAIPIYGAP